MLLPAALLLLVTFPLLLASFLLQQQLFGKVYKKESEYHHFSGL
jgi:hypothetical protein